MTPRGVDRQQLAAEVAGGDAERDVDEAVDHQHPHRGEMPRSAPASQPPSVMSRGKVKAKQRRGVVDLPAEPIITRMAMALIQCVMRTQSG